MRSLILPELSLDCRFSSKRKTIGEIFGEVSRTRCVSEKILKLEDYADRLREEMKKIDAFKRELPLCMLLLSNAIVATDEELAQCKKSNAEPVLEEFMPLKKICKDEKVETSPEKDISCRDKMSWMSSVQLWNSENDPTNDKLTLKLDNRKKRTEEEMIRPVMNNLFQSSKNRRVETSSFLPFKRCDNFPLVVKENRDESSVPALSLCTPELKSSREGINPIGFSPKSCSSSRSGSSSATNVQSDINGQNQTIRKQRRCWSPDLHRQFVNALQQLGGPQAATPKQIRELMQVDGLTNDEVKSHLQKYRLHTRRLSTNSSSPSVELWMSQEQCNESMKQSDSESGSPEGPLMLDGSPQGNSGGNDEEDEEQYEGHNWKDEIRLSGTGRDDDDV